MKGYLFVCERCGSVVANTNQHNMWHDSLNANFTTLNDDIPPEDNSLSHSSVCQCSPDRFIFPEHFDDCPLDGMNPIVEIL